MLIFWFGFSPYRISTRQKATLAPPASIIALVTVLTPGCKDRVFDRVLQATGPAAAVDGSVDESASAAKPVQATKSKDGVGDVRIRFPRYCAHARNTLPRTIVHGG